MSGTYPDAPGARIHYDRDGTLLIPYDSNGTGQAQLANSWARSFNSETGTSYDIPNFGFLAFVFPSAKDIVGHFTKVGGIGSGGPGVIQYSTDTTNGQDGTWTQLANTWGANVTLVPTYRTAINLGTWNNVKAIRLTKPNTGTYGLSTLHLYGKHSVAVSDRLSFWHPTVDQALSDFPAYLDWGDRPRVTIATKSFRIKNRSATLTASGIAIGVEALTDTSPTMVSQYMLSMDGGSTWASTVTLPSLTPGSLSTVIQIRQVLSASATTGNWDQRVYATPGSWA